MEKFIKDIRTDITNTFKNEDFEKEKNIISKKYQDKRDALLENLNKQSAKYGFQNILYLTAYLSVNLGFVNIIPFPAFDGGRILFVLIEKIKGSPVKPEVENIFHTVGFILLMILMLVITYQDILRLFVK